MITITAFGVSTKYFLIVPYNLLNNFRQKKKYGKSQFILWLQINIILFYQKISNSTSLGITFSYRKIDDLIPMYILLTELLTYNSGLPMDEQYSTFYFFSFYILVVYVFVRLSTISYVLYRILSLHII